MNNERKTGDGRLLTKLRQEAKENEKKLNDARYKAIIENDIEVDDKVIKKIVPAKKKRKYTKTPDDEYVVKMKEAKREMTRIFKESLCQKYKNEFHVIIFVFGGVIRLKDFRKTFKHTDRQAKDIIDRFVEYSLVDRVSWANGYKVIKVKKYAFEYFLKENKKNTITDTKVRRSQQYAEFFNYALPNIYMDEYDLKNNSVSFINSATNLIHFIPIKNSTILKGLNNFFERKTLSGKNIKSELGMSMLRDDYTKREKVKDYTFKVFLQDYRIESGLSAYEEEKGQEYAILQRNRNFQLTYLQFLEQDPKYKEFLVIQADYDNKETKGSMFNLYKKNIHMAKRDAFRRNDKTVFVISIAIFTFEERSSDSSLNDGIKNKMNDSLRYYKYLLESETDDTSVQINFYIITDNKLKYKELNGLIRQVEKDNNMIGLGTADFNAEDKQFYVKNICCNKK